MANKFVFMTGVDGAIGSKVANTLADDGFKILDFEGDVSKVDDWFKCIDRIEYAGIKKIWAIVHCAGICNAAKIYQLVDDDFKKMYDVNCMPIFYSIKYIAAKYMFDYNSIGDIVGHIVNVNSISGLQGQSYLSHYCASKFAANGLMLCAAKELGQYGILVNSVCPGPTKGLMWEKLDKDYSEINGWPKDKSISDKYFGRQIIKRLAEPEDTANVISFLISDRNKFITGTHINVSGGNATGI